MYDSCKNRKSEERKGKCRDFTCNSKADKVSLVYHKSRRELVCCDLFRGPRSSSASWCSTVCTTKHPSTSSTSASLSSVSPPDNIFVLPAEVFSSCDMELVTRQSERSGHQRRLLQALTKDVFIFSAYSCT